MKSCTERAPHVACDGSATRSKRLAAFPDGVGGYADRGEGCYLYLDDKRRYIDWACSLGATPLGYRHQVINAAVKQQIDRGVLFSLPSVMEERVAGKLCAALGWPEQVKFVKTGSEATSGAIRIARAATGRRMILGLNGHYHGWHDWWAIQSPDHPGVPEPDMAWDVLSSTEAELYRDIELHRPAAVILEPTTRDWVPTTSWLATLKEKCHEHGTLLIFDEMLTGGRIRLGGGTEYFEVQPDLATYGKAFGAGWPLAFVVGSRALMAHAQYVSGTFSGDAVALAACEAMLGVYARQSVIDRLWAIGGAMQDVCEKEHVPTSGLPPLFAVSLPMERMARLVKEAARQGVLIHPGFIAANTAIDDRALALSREALRSGLQRAREEARPTDRYAAGMR